MKKLSLKWRITLMIVLLIGLTSVTMVLLLSSSGVRYMDSIGELLQDQMISGKSAFFDPEELSKGQYVTIVISGAQKDFCYTNWIICIVVTILSGIIAYFVSDYALKPLRTFTSQTEKVEVNNLGDIKLDEDVMPEFQQLSFSFNAMLERLNNAFAAQKQFTGNAAHELRTPLALMQAQVELFAAEHKEVDQETATFLALLAEQTERLTFMTKTLLEMSNLGQVERKDKIELGEMVEEIFTDLIGQAEKKEITLEHEGCGMMAGSDTLIYRLLFNLIENAIKYNKVGGKVKVSIEENGEEILVKVKDTGVGIPKEAQKSIFQPFFRIDKSRSRQYGGAGLGLSLVWEIATLHGGSVWVESSSENGSLIVAKLMKR